MTKRVFDESSSFFSGIEIINGGPPPLKKSKTLSTLVALSVARAIPGDVNQSKPGKKGYRKKFRAPTFFKICPHAKIQGECECGSYKFCAHKRAWRFCVAGCSLLSKPCAPTVKAKTRRDKKKKPKVQCVHGRNKYNCFACGSKSMCPHNRKWKECDDCGTRLKCIHGIYPKNCRSCGGNRFCKHSKWRSGCAECFPKTRCCHGKRKWTCLSCSPHLKCDHGKLSHKCLKCARSGVCVHKIWRRLCRHCGGSALCVGCKGVVVKKKGEFCKQYCMPRVKRRSAIKEKAIAFFLQKWAESGLIPKYTSWNKVNRLSDTAICGRPQPDFVYDLGDRIVILECDEFQHKSSNYLPRCELLRIVRIVEGYRTIPGYFIPVHIIRYNPDGFKIGGEKGVISLAKKMELLKERLISACENDQTEHRLVIEKLCYDNDNSGAASSRLDFIQIEKYETISQFEELIDRMYPLPGMEELFLEC